MEKTEDLYHRVVERKGGEIALAHLTSKPLTYDEYLLGNLYVVIASCISNESA